MNYGCSILALHRNAFNAFSKTYYASLKVALGLKLYTSRKRMCLATGIWPAHLNVYYHFMRVTLKLEELYGAVSLPRIVLETKGLIVKRYGFSEDDLTCAELKLKFQRIFVLWAYKGHSMDPLPVSYKYSVWNSDSDYYLVLFWCKCILNLTKTHLSKGNNLVDDKCPRCLVVGSQRHFLNDCVLNDPLRRKLVNNDLVRLDSCSLYRQSRNMLLNTRKMTPRVYVEYGGLIERFMQESHRILMVEIGRMKGRSIAMVPGTAAM